MSYVPAPPPSDEKDLMRWIVEELRQVGRAFENIEAISLQRRHRPPAKVTDGMIVLADGTNWDPGSGEGVYRWDSDTSSWKFLG